MLEFLNGTAGIGALKEADSNKNCFYFTIGGKLCKGPTAVVVASAGL